MTNQGAGIVLRPVRAVLALPTKPGALWELAQRPVEGMRPRWCPSDLRVLFLFQIAARDQTCPAKRATAKEREVVQFRPSRAGGNPEIAAGRNTYEIPTAGLPEGQAARE